MPYFNKFGRQRRYEHEDPYAYDCLEAGCKNNPLGEPILPRQGRLLFKIMKLSIKSKASRIFSLFKPKDPVVNENFDLVLTVINLNQETYKNGYVSCKLRYVDADISDISPTEVRFLFDALRPNEEKDLWAMNQTALSSGSVLIHEFNLVCDGKLVARGDKVSGSTIPCHSFINSTDQGIDKDNPLSFHVASKEELYQKYGVIVAVVVAVAIAVISFILGRLTHLLGL